MDSYDRFNDLLDNIESDEDDDAVVDGASRAIPPTLSHEPSHGPLHWNTRCSIELQKVVDTFKMEELYDIDFSVTVADPTRPDCPLVACSIGFTELTGYKVHEIVGRNCRFLLNGVPTDLVDDETRVQCRSFCLSVSQGKEYDGQCEVLPAGLFKCWVPLPKGELICLQTNATKSGELFRNMFYLKQVELDESPFILGLQAGIPEEFEESPMMHKLQKRIQGAWEHLDSNMSSIEQVLSSQFWFQAPMRRQI